MNVGPNTGGQSQEDQKAARVEFEVAHERGRENIFFCARNYNFAKTPFEKGPDPVSLLSIVPLKWQALRFVTCTDV